MSVMVTVLGLIILLTHQEIVDALLVDLFTTRTTNYTNTGTDSDLCEENRTPPRIAAAIVGGLSMKSISTAPYIAAIGERLSNGSVSWFCGGSLLDQDTVLTAAHCLSKRDADYVSLGKLYLSNQLGNHDYRIVRKVVHPDYEATSPYHDLAVVKLNQTVRFTKSIRPICLPANGKDNFTGDTASVVGWGTDTVEAGGDGSPNLRQVRVEVFSNSRCDEAYSEDPMNRRTFPRGITDQQLCAGSREGGKDACKGDSGGPLVLTDPRGVIRLIGVVSSGTGCGIQSFPGVYIRVSEYLSWINQQLGGNE